MKTRTRGQELGVYPRSIRARNMRALRSIGNQIDKIVSEWDGLDGAVEGAAEELRYEIDRFYKTILHSLALLDQPFDS